MRAHNPPQTQQTYDDEDVLSGADARLAAQHPDIFTCVDDVPCHLTYSEDETD